MIISYKRSGGFAGLRLETKVDVTTLSDDEKTSVTKWLAEGGITDKSLKSGRGRGFDMFNYEITVENNGEQHTVKLDDSTKPAKLNPLIKFLETKIQKAK